MSGVVGGEAARTCDPCRGVRETSEPRSGVQLADKPRCLDFTGTRYLQIRPRSRVCIVAPTGLVSRPSREERLTKTLRDKANRNLLDVTDEGDLSG